MSDEPSQGWKFLKRGQCSSCSEAETMLFVPVIEDALPVENHDSVTGEHIPHFEPVCRGCSGQFDLSTLCKQHRLPLMIGRQICRRCITTVLCRTAGLATRG